jgi:hypothetical protein
MIICERARSSVRPVRYTGESAAIGCAFNLPPGTALNDDFVCFLRGRSRLMTQLGPDRAQLFRKKSSKYLWEKGERGWCYHAQPINVDVGNGYPNICLG